MKNKYSDSAEDEFCIDEDKFNNLRLRQETELFDDTSYVVHDIINVKRVELPQDEEEWEITKNKEIVLTIKGIRFTKKEKLFLRTAQGMLFLISGYKNGWKTTEFKKKIKSAI